MQEVAYLLERSDITEEIVRSNIHVETFIDYLKYDEPVGKRLSFLIQELNREVNTIGSKSDAKGSLVKRQRQIATSAGNKDQAPKWELARRIENCCSPAVFSSTTH